MKLLLSLLVVIAAVVVAAERSSLSLTPLPWSSRPILAGPFVSVGAAKDLLVHIDGPDYFVNIRRRNNDGDYITVANWTQVSSPFVATNGKWIVQSSEGNTLVTVDANNELSEASFIPTYGGFILSDDTFVGYETLGKERYAISTFEYSAANNNWTSIAAAQLPITTEVESIGGFGTYHVSDTHLTLLDYTDQYNVSIKLYKRLANKSWSLTDTLRVTNITLGNFITVLYNDVDTLVLSNLVSTGTSVGVVTTFTKINGEWVKQTFTTESVGYKPAGYLGVLAVFLDANNLLVTAYAEGALEDNGPPSNAGKVLLLTRNANGQWQPALDLVGSGVFGYGLAANEYDVIIASLAPQTQLATFYTVPRCFFEPMNVTCHDQQVSDCSDITSAELYTINNPQCGAVTTAFKGFSLVNNQAVEAQFSFSRSFGEEYSCNVTVTCPAPPVAPVTKNTSGANTRQFGLGFVLVIAAVLFA